MVTAPQFLLVMQALLQLAQPLAAQFLPLVHRYFMLAVEMLFTEFQPPHLPQVQL